MFYYLNSILALSQRIPKLDGLVPTSRNDLTVVSRKSNTQYILN